MNNDKLVATLVAALQQAQLYLDSYDTSAPSRVRATTNGLIEAALAFAREQSGSCACVGRHHCQRFSGSLVTVREE